MKAALLLIVGVIIGVAAGGYGTLVGDLFTRGAYQQ
jgi:hypothetical protein